MHSKVRAYFFMRNAYIVHLIIRRRMANDVRWTSVLRGPEQSVDRVFKSGCLLQDNNIQNETYSI